MSDRPPVELTSAAGEHPAAAAWRALGQDHSAPSAIEKVKGREGGGRTVYRLLQATPGGDSVIAKRYRVAVHSVERMFYQEVLPYLPVSTPRYYGELKADDEFVWVFLEDAGSQRLSPQRADHRTLAARWLGAMHAAGPELPAARRLPDRGPQHYRRHLDAGRRLILENLANPALETDDVTLLRSVVASCDLTERRWSELEEICAAAPSTLVHGDFRPKNMYVQAPPGEPQRLLLIDWETAGWGPPAADLAPMRHEYLPQVDLEEYCRIVQRRWPRFDLRLAHRLMWVGLVFRRLAAIEWAALSLPFPQKEVLATPVSRLRFHGEQLRRALEDGSWGPPGDRKPNLDDVPRTLQEAE
jgi:hypothetical protein